MHAIAIHGGAGTLPRAEMTPEREAAYRGGLAAALDAGYAVLDAGGTSLDAVIAAVRILEDDPLFNAGRGAVLTHEGIAELDASIMNGASLAAGAVAGVRHVKNPIELARAVMEHSAHVMLIGAGAEEFALARGLTLVPNEYFRTETRKAQLQRVLTGDTRPANELSALGTVGAVALDRAGNLAAATSTGGMTAKRYGRVGDSPIIGAGQYCDNTVGAAGSTGRGESNIMTCGGFLVVEFMRQGNSPEQAIMKAMERVVATTQAKLMGSNGRPFVDLQFYAVARDGRYAGGTLYEGASFAVCDERGPRTEPCVYLYRASERPRR